LTEDFREKSSTGNLFPFSFRSFLDSPTQVMHDIYWKIDGLIRNQEVQHQFMIQTGLISTSTLLKEEFIYNLQKYPVLDIHVHQLGCWISFQQQLGVAFKQSIFPTNILHEPSFRSHPAGFSNHPFYDRYWDSHHRILDF